MRTALQIDPSYISLHLECIQVSRLQAIACQSRAEAAAATLDAISFFVDSTGLSAEIDPAKIACDRAPGCVYASSAVETGHLWDLLGKTHYLLARTLEVEPHRHTILAIRAWMQAVEWFGNVRNNVTPLLLSPPLFDYSWCA